VKLLLLSLSFRCSNLFDLSAPTSQEPKIGYFPLNNSHEASPSCKSTCAVLDLFISFLSFLDNRCNKELHDLYPSPSIIRIIK
jgi:hypothetical protein